MKIYESITGNSVTLGFLLPEDYDLLRIKAIDISLGGRTLAHTIDDRMAVVELTSEQTMAYFGSKKLIFSIDDHAFGVRKIPIGEIYFTKTLSNFNTKSIDNGYNVVIKLKFTEDFIEVDDIMYNYLRCQSPYEIAVENGYTGTEAEFNEQLGSFENFHNEAIEAKNDAELAATNAALSAEQAEQAKDYLENQLFHYISDDDISVRVGIGTQVLVSESTTGYPSVIIQLDTL